MYFEEDNEWKINIRTNYRKYYSKFNMDTLIVMMDDYSWNSSVCGYYKKYCIIIYYFNYGFFRVKIINLKSE